MAKRGSGGAAGVADPLDLARGALRTANRALSAEERAAREREQLLGGDPPPLTPEEEAFEDQYEALQHHLLDLPTDHSARAEVYFLSPVPPGCEAPHKVPGAISDFRAIDDLGEEIERLIQRAGFWGSYKVRVRPKVFCPGPHQTGRGNPCPGRRWHFEGHHDLSLTVRRSDEAAEIAAASGRGAPATPAIDPITAARTMLEAGKALTPPVPEKSQAETLGPLIASVAGAFEKLATTQAGPSAEIWKAAVPLIPPLITRLLTPPKDDFLEKLVLMREAGLMRGGGGSGLQEILPLLRFAMERAGDGGGGERTWADRLFDLLDRHAESGLARAKDLLDVARARAAQRAAAPPATALPASSAPVVAGLADFQRELAQQAAQQNPGFFPTLRERIVALFPTGGPELLDAVSADAGADAMGLARLSEAGVQLTPAVQAYLKTFCNWLRYVRRQQGGTPPPGAATVNGAAPVRARCQKCGTTYQLDDEAQWTEDTKVCDNAGCGGELVRV